MAGAFVDRFGSLAADYATFRPTYPSALFDWLASEVRSNAVAWDCATGSGQAAVALAEHFERVIATDASAEQIAKANCHPRVEYRMAPAEESGIDAGSVNLISVAQALHWFSIDRFFHECDRVLRPGGVLAVWAYGPLQVEDEPVNAVIQRYYHDIVGPWWPRERTLVESGYQSVALPYTEIKPPSLKMVASWTLHDLLGYLGTWTATSAYRSALGKDPRELIEGLLAQMWGNPATPREIIWPLTIRAGRKGQA